MNNMGPAPRPKGGMARDYENKLRDDIARDAFLMFVREGINYPGFDENMDNMAITSYHLANAMLAARASTKKETE